MTGEAKRWTPNLTPAHPPFEPGHELSLQHGAYSPRRVDPLAAGLVESMVADGSLGYLAAPAYRPALWAWARAEAQVQLLTEYLERRAAAAEAEDSMHAGVGDLDDDRVKSAYLLLHRAEARALAGRQRLGLDPLSRARLGKDVAQGRAADAATTLTQLRAELERVRGVAKSDVAGDEVASEDHQDEQDDDEEDDGGE